ncbi:hypothetical protein Zm00014a_020800 [Zea mays]|uniref:Uncharacterized protein n=1 Tax=Zea mays TaxID=4577 RepID=A0A3L6FC67_MAIZE|nr:hypothetical protein Zm00014a_020800 [Zea mays]
MDKVTRDI